MGSPALVPCSLACMELHDCGHSEGAHLFACNPALAVHQVQPVRQDVAAELLVPLADQQLQQAHHCCQTVSTCWQTVLRQCLGHRYLHVQTASAAQAATCTLHSAEAAQYGSDDMQQAIQAMRLADWQWS